MAVAQKNINFGRVAVGEHASKTVAIQNRSPVPLLYRYLAFQILTYAFNARIT
jgi:hypothetical protein